MAKRERRRRGAAYTPDAVRRKKEGKKESPGVDTTGASVEAIASKYLRVGTTGHQHDNLAVHCPFHKGGQERRPSMYVYIGGRHGKTAPGTCYCFTCGEGWALTQVIEALGADAHDVAVVRDLTGTVRTNIEQIDKLIEQVHYEPGEHLDFTGVSFLPERALYLFDSTPKALIRSGFSRDTLARNEVGFDPVLKRITYPIRDHLGRLLAVSGRSTRSYQFPRYKVYDKEFYDLVPGYDPPKGKALWGLHDSWDARLRDMAAEYKPLILCEGFKAKMWVEQALTQHGLQVEYDVVAMMGTALTKTHKELLQVAASRAIFFLDNDRAGAKAMHLYRRVLPTVEKRWANYNTLDHVSPDDLDPAEVVRAVRTAQRYRTWKQARAGMGEDREELVKDDRKRIQATEGGRASRGR